MRVTSVKSVKGARINALIPVFMPGNVTGIGKVNVCAMISFYSIKQR